MKINAQRGGFTLVEIMIVVAIIALLASIAVPNFMRARKRSQATVIKNELRIVDSAVDQYAIENNLKTDATVSWDNIKKYLKDSTPLYMNGGKDSLGGAIGDQKVGTLPKIDADTVAALSDAVEPEFWSPYK